MNKLFVDYNEYKFLIAKLCRDIMMSGWKPDYVVGITRGGLLPAVMISHYFDVPCHTLKVSLRDSGDNDTESNCWMADHAIGYKLRDKNDKTSGFSDLESRKNILIVDDINDTGATFNWILKDWPSSCLGDNPAWNEVWNNNVKFSVLVDNLSSIAQVKMDYSGIEINKANNDLWVVFPWENWWLK
jgi:xanthine phosphoribosyltransferase